MVKAKEYNDVCERNQEKRKEIKALQAENAQLKQTIAENSAKWTMAAVENRRLREAGN